MQRCEQCNKFHVIGFDYGHEERVVNDMDDDFIATTIRSVDEYLQGERQAEMQVLNAPREDDWEHDARAEWTAAQRAEYDAVAQAEDDQYWACHCPKHGSELQGERAYCLECEAELADERIQDR